MSGAWTGLTWDELDRLADYTAGALSGAEADEVARLISTDDRWAAAHAELLAAQPAVSAALRSAAETPVTMPAEVAARLDAALADARSDRPASGGPSRPHRTSPSSTGPSSTGPSGTRPPGTRPRRVRPGRPRRVPALLRIAAGVLVLAAMGGLGTLALRGVTNGVRSATDAGEVMSGPGNESAEAPVVASDAGTRILASGTDYTSASLPNLVHEGAAVAPKPSGGLDVDMNRLTVEDSLTDVATPDGLARCLTTLRSAYPGMVTVVDFARFEGEPAVVVVVQDGAAITVVALGARCGTDGPDELASVRVR
ncbi:MAG: hypothetical protein IRY85_08150 [Micromonosporaceae bacterium]|nr:hypothetical protein [Micromonosporaceae bacterium]